MFDPIYPDEALKLRPESRRLAQLRWQMKRWSEAGNAASVFAAYQNQKFNSPHFGSICYVRVRRDEIATVAPRLTREWLHVGWLDLTLGEVVPEPAADASW